MPEAIVGLSAFYHDSAAAVLVDCKIVAAAQEERFTRKKLDSAFPTNALGYVLEEAGLVIADLAAVAFGAHGGIRAGRVQRPAGGHVLLLLRVPVAK